jgi:hypothetical protein
MDIFFKTEQGQNIKIGNVSSKSASHICIATNEWPDECLGFLNLTGKKIDLFEESYRKMKKMLNLTEIELLRSIPPDIIGNKFCSITESLQNVLCYKDNEEYLVSYLEIKRFLRKLSAPLVDKGMLDKIVSEIKHEATANRVLALTPGNSGKPPLTKYGMLGSRTGRLIVKEGPQILTIPSKARKAFVSEYPSGKVLQIDVISAEPKIALLMQRKNCANDIYEHISKVILDNKVSRDQAKLITLCALYGQSASNLKKSLPDDINPKHIIRKTRDFFDVRNLERMLQDQMQEGSLRNALGRPLIIPDGDTRLLISYFLQSSAAELSILSFSNWYNENKERARPLYVIHDALIVDCNEQLGNELIKKETLTLNVGDWFFEAKVSRF